MRRPLAWLTLCLCLGIGAAFVLRPVFWISFSACLGLVLACCFLPDIPIARDPLLLLCVFFAGLALVASRVQIPYDGISRYASFDPARLISARAEVLSAREDVNGGKYCTLRSRAVVIGRVETACNGEFQAKLNARDEPPGGISAGDLLLLSGNLLPARRQRGCAAFSRSSIVARPQFICFPGGVRMLGRITRGWLFRLAADLKDRFIGILLRTLSPQGAAVMSAMLLGDASGISAFIYQDMVRTGTVHVLVVSGTNVGLVVFVFHLLLKILRIPRRPRFIFLFPAIVLYCLMTGASPPVIRAGIMASVFVAAYLLQRQSDIIDSCCLAVLAMLAWDPRQLADVSFQLSFASVLSIILIFPRLKSWLRADALKPKILAYICDSCLVSASAWLGTGFLLAWYFQMVSPVSILANLFIVPLAGLITLSGACLVISSWLAPCITRFCAVSCDHAVFLMVVLNSWFANLPWAYFSWKQPC